MCSLCNCKGAIVNKSIKCFDSQSVVVHARVGTMRVACKECVGNRRRVARRVVSGGGESLLVRKRKSIRRVDKQTWILSNILVVYKIKLYTTMGLIRALLYSAVFNAQWLECRQGLTLLTIITLLRVKAAETWLSIMDEEKAPTRDVTAWFARASA